MKSFTQPLNIFPSLVLLSLLAAGYFVIDYSMRAPYVFVSLAGEVFDKNKMIPLIFMVTYSFLLFFIIPAATAKLIYKEDLRNLGLMVPKNTVKAVFYILLSLSLLIPWILLFTNRMEFQNYSQGQLSLIKFGVVQLILLPTYYFAEEFFFRGFLFISLWKRVGWHSFWITDIFFTYAHIGKPPLEILMAIPTSIVLNYLTLQTRSIYPAILVHGALGLLLNILVTFK